jgi:hypothetical protein
MTKLEKLYSIIENSREVGVKLSKDVLQHVGVTKVETERATEIKRYAIDGRAIKDSHKGVNIIKMNNGTIKKVVVK